ncbi:MAG: PHP domain-containing protein [Acidimicrobiia bacterium]|nr:PHP domain-containing protein [Acidimicrobiia bacterium]
MIDLHVHSSASDGVDDPREVVRLAAEAGVEVLALTDHDTLAGIPEAMDATHATGMRLIPGTELSVDLSGTKMHMLVYFIEDEQGPLGSRLASLRTGRDERNAAIIGRLNELGYEVTLSDVRRHARGPSVGRPHIADALVERGYFGSRSEVFAGVLHDGGPGYVSRPRLDAVEAIELSRESGAVPVVAHPATIPVPPQGYRRLFEDLVAAGLGGIEAHHPMHAPGLREHLTDLAHELGIAATGGSDYHGAEVRDYRIARGTGDLRVPISAVEELDEQRIA